MQFFPQIQKVQLTDYKVRVLEGDAGTGARVRAILEVENQAKAFAIPRQALFEKDGKKFVYRRRDGHYGLITPVPGTSDGR